MSAEKKGGPSCVPDTYTISVCGVDEIRITDTCNQEVRQKYVRVVPESRNFESDWTWEELLNIGALLHEAPEFKTDLFKPYVLLIVNLGYRLVHNPTRQTIVDAILKITDVWYKICTNDDKCYPPPSRKTLQDPQQRKVLNHINELQTRLVLEGKKRAKENAELGQIYNDLNREDQMEQQDRAG